MVKIADKYTVAHMDNSLFGRSISLFVNLAVINALSEGGQPWVFDLESDGCQVEFEIGEA